MVSRYKHIPHSSKRDDINFRLCVGVAAYPYYGGNDVHMVLDFGSALRLLVELLEVDISDVIVEIRRVCNVRLSWL